MVVYAVARGRQVGVFQTWRECSAQVNKFQGGIYKKFKTESEASEFVKKNSEPPKTVVESLKFTIRYIEEEPKKTIQRKRKLGLISMDYDEVEVIRNFTDPKEFESSFVQVYTDGACEKNGSTHARGGLGVYFPNDEYKNISMPLSGKQTNNRAELSAIIQALQTVDTTKNLIIYTDSQYAINGIQGINKINRNADLFTEISDLVALRKSRPRFAWVKGHTGELDGNFYADLLAGEGISKGE